METQEGNAVGESIIKVMREVTAKLLLVEAESKSFEKVLSHPSYSWILKMALSLDLTKSGNVMTFVDSLRHCIENPNTVKPRMNEYDDSDENSDDLSQVVTPNQIEDGIPPPLTLPPISSLLHYVPSFEHEHLHHHNSNHFFPHPSVNPICNTIFSHQPSEPFSPFAYLERPLLPSFDALFKRPTVDHSSIIQFEPQNPFPQVTPLNPILQPSPQFVCDCVDGNCCTYTGRGSIGCKCLKIGTSCSPQCHPSHPCLVDVLKRKKNDGYFPPSKRFLR